MQGRLNRKFLLFLLAVLAYFCYIWTIAFSPELSQPLPIVTPTRELEASKPNPNAGWQADNEDAPDETRSFTSPLEQPPLTKPGIVQPTPESSGGATSQLVDPTDVPNANNPIADSPTADSQIAIQQAQGNATINRDAIARGPNTNGPTALQERNNFKRKEAAPRNVILLIGDGMGFEQLKAASLYAYGEEGKLFMHSAPFQSAVNTDNLLNGLTDSAAAATAMATGQKVANSVISVGSAGQPLETSLEFFQQRCKRTGLVATSYLNHATPAAFAAHQPQRTLLTQIANDFFTQTRPNVLFGGVREGISPEIAEANGYAVVTTRAELNTLSLGNVSHVSGQFGYDNMAFEFDHHKGSTNFYNEHPHLSEMAQEAIDILSQGKDGFFLMVEGSRIDHAGHQNSLERVIFEVLEFDRTVEQTVNWAEQRDDTLVIVAADHETGGLDVLHNQGAAQLPKVSWSTFGHSPAAVPIFGWGIPGDNSVVISENVDIYSLTTAGQAPVPQTCLIADDTDAAGSSGDVLPEADVHGNESTAQTNQGTLGNSTALDSRSNLSPDASPAIYLPLTASDAALVPSVTVSLESDSLAWIGPGGEITYTVNYATDDSAVEDVSMFSQVPKGLWLHLAKTQVMPSSAMLSISNLESDSDRTTMLTWRLGSLAANSTGQVSYVAFRPSTANNVGTDLIQIEKEAPQEAIYLQPIVYGITITNLGAEPLTDLFVTEKVPFGALYLGGADSSPEEERIMWQLEMLGPQASHTFRYNATLKQSAMSQETEVYTLGGERAVNYKPLVTNVADYPLRDNPDGFVAVNNNTWATWQNGVGVDSASATPLFNPQAGY